jgi:hypothetical protein
VAEHYMEVRCIHRLDIWFFGFLNFWFLRILDLERYMEVHECRLNEFFVGNGFIHKLFAENYVVNL